MASALGNVRRKRTAAATKLGRRYSVGKFAETHGKLFWRRLGRSGKEGRRSKVWWMGKFFARKAKGIFWLGFSSLVEQRSRQTECRMGKFCRE